MYYLTYNLFYGPPKYQNTIISYQNYKKATWLCLNYKYFMRFRKCGRTLMTSYGSRRFPRRQHAVVPGHIWGDVRSNRCPRPTWVLLNLFQKEIGFRTDFLKKIAIEHGVEQK